MKILTDMSQADLADSGLTIGFFDGVHRGHKFLIGKATASAHEKGIRAVLLSFFPHPNVVLRGAEPYYLTTREEKLALLSELGLDLIIIQRFTPGLAQTRASEFVDRLITQLGMVELWVGPDFGLGYRREGDTVFLQRMGLERGYTLNIVDRLRLDDIAISSSRIRQALREGDVTLAARCLGRLYCVQGPVVIGAQRGRSLGFPTANIEVPQERAVPANGVYAAWGRLAEATAAPAPHDPTGYHTRGQDDDAGFGQVKSQGEQSWRAVVNIGTRPTFDNGPRTIEAHLLDFDRDIYGRRLHLDFAARLRPEKRFNGIDELVKQIERDASLARQFLHQSTDT
jgi:riboflavin kinase/FMN adenylyltransferase